MSYFHINYLKTSVPPSFKLEFDLWAKTMVDDGSKKFENVKISRFSIPCNYDPIMAVPKEKNTCNKIRTTCKAVSYELIPWKPDFDNYAYTSSELQFKTNNRNYWIDYYREKAPIKRDTQDFIKEMNADSTVMKYSKVQDADEPKFKRPRTTIYEVLTTSQIFKITVSTQKIIFGKVSRPKIPF